MRLNRLRWVRMRCRERCSATSQLHPSTWHQGISAERPVRWPCRMGGGWSVFGGVCGGWARECVDHGGCKQARQHRTVSHSPFSCGCDDHMQSPLIGDCGWIASAKRVCTSMHRSEPGAGRSGWMCSRCTSTRHSTVKHGMSVQ